MADLAHGTWMTGLVAAANNDYGIVGVAYNATVSAYRVIDTEAEITNTWTSIADALSNTANFDVANNSWEFTSALEDSAFLQQTTIATNALLTAAKTGLGGLGTINVFAAGNGYASGDDTNLHAFPSSINVVTVAALDDTGKVNAPGGRYSTRGASIPVSALGTGILSDTIVGQGNTADAQGNLNFESGLEGTANSTGGIAATGTTFSFTVPPSDSLTLNWVRVQLDFYFTTFDNLRIVLTSPGGAASVLLNQPNDGMGGSPFNNTVQAHQRPVLGAELCWNVDTFCRRWRRCASAIACLRAWPGGMSPLSGSVAVGRTARDILGHTWFGPCASWPVPSASVCRRGTFFYRRTTRSMRMAC